MKGVSRATQAFRAVRIAWVLVAATMILLAVVLHDGGDVPAIVLALISAPAGLLTNFFTSSPVRIEGLPDPPIYPLVMAGFGFVQWFWIAPRAISRITAWHRSQSVAGADVSRKEAPDDADAPAVATVAPPMTRRRLVAAGVLITIGAWYGAVYLAFWLTVALAPINNRLIFEDNAGVLIMNVWFAVPLSATAAAATMVVTWLVDGKRKWLWVGVLACLFLYSGAARVPRALGSSNASQAIDSAGLIVRAITPAAVCVLAGLYRLKRS